MNDDEKNALIEHRITRAVDSIDEQNPTTPKATSKKSGTVIYDNLLPGE